MGRRSKPVAPKEPHRQAVGQWVATQRIQHKWPQVVLAAKINRGAATVKKIEQGQRLPSLDVATLLLEIFTIPEGERSALIVWLTGWDHHLLPPGPERRRHRVMRPPPPTPPVLLPTEAPTRVLTEVEALQAAIAVQGHELAQLRHTYTELQTTLDQQAHTVRRRSYHLERRWLAFLIDNERRMHEERQERQGILRLQREAVYARWLWVGFILLLAWVATVEWSPVGWTKVTAIFIAGGFTIARPLIDLQVLEGKAWWAVWRSRMGWSTAFLCFWILMFVETYLILLPGLARIAYELVRYAATTPLFTPTPGH